MRPRRAVHRGVNSPVTLNIRFARYGLPQGSGCPFHLRPAADLRAPFANHAGNTTTDVRTMPILDREADAVQR
jgi:hypothetical protein